MSGLLLPAVASAEARLGRFIGVIDGLPEVMRVVFAEERTAYALHAGEPPVLRLLFDDDEAMPRLERLSVAEAREADAPDELWYGSVDASHPLWIDPPPTDLITLIDMARDSDGNTLLLDKHANALHRYDKRAGAWRSIGGWGAFPGLFAHPSAVAAADGRIYVADTRNHRIQVFDDRLSYLGEWGLHIVRPHEDEGHLHYPAEIAVSGDRTLAIVAEPVQDRVQIFGRVREGEEGAIAEPMFERETIAHFGPHAARDGQLVVTTEPDRPGVIVWDLSRPLPIMIGQIVGHGDGFGLFRSVGDVALSVDGPNGMPRVWVLDPALQRLQVFDLDWSPEKVLGFDPFMARFVRAFDLAALLDRGDARIKGFLLRADGSLVLHDAARGSLIVTDTRLRPQRTLDGLHEPAERVRLSAGYNASTVALLHAHTGVVDLFGFSGEDAGERKRLDLLEMQQGGDRVLVD